MEQIQRLNSQLELRNRLLQETFGRYLSDEIVHNLLESPDGLALGGKKRFITVLMTDLRGFTFISEQMDVEAVVSMLNHYFSEMVDIIHKHNGTVIEFIGDAVLAIFGAPVEDGNHADEAVACAVEMQLTMESVNAWNQQNGYPRLEMGIGINTGETIVGNIGSEKTTKYNVIGRHVNLCSRVESYTTGGQIMLCEYTYTTLKSDVHVVKSMQVQPKGVSEPIVIYQIDAIGAPYNLSIQKKELLLHHFEKPIPVWCYRIRNKQVEPIPFWITLSALSEKELIAACDKLELYENVKLCLDTPETEVLAKVVEKVENESFLIQFTTDAQAFFSKVLAICSLQ
jgi:adenylate cyclase